MQTKTNQLPDFPFVNFNNFHIPGDTMLSPTGYRVAFQSIVI